MNPSIYIGTYTPAGGASRGIYALGFNPKTGRLGPSVLAAETENPTFLALNSAGDLLYALGESGRVDGRPGGAVRAFTRNRSTGALEPLNIQPTGGAGTTHVALDATGRMLVAVSYSGGQIASFPVATDGRIGPRAAWILPSGPTGPRTARQDRPHPHSVTFSPDNRFAYVCDLGLDRIFCFRLDPPAAGLTPAGEFAAEPGAGPRHSASTPDGRFLYVINELASTLAVHARDSATGALERTQTVTTLPSGFAGGNTTAEVRIHPNGRFVYGSNRGHDSLAAFSRDPASGALALVQIVPCGGRHPRNFALTPDGRWLVCANRDTNSVAVFSVDADSGRLAATGGSADVPQPVCVIFAPQS